MSLQPVSYEEMRKTLQKEYEDYRPNGHQFVTDWEQVSEETLLTAYQLLAASYEEKFPLSVRCFLKSACTMALVSDYGWQYRFEQLKEAYRLFRLSGDAETIDRLLDDDDNQELKAAV